MKLAGRPRDRARRRLVALCLAVASGVAAADEEDRLTPYVQALAEHGRDPVELVVETLAERDLILFDDAVHSAVEPFAFYERLVRSPTFRRRARLLFVEVFHVDQQHHLDAYLASRPEDLTLLRPVLQSDYAGTGWALSTYLSLLRTVHQVNRTAPARARLRVVAVSNPWCWRCIDSADDLRLARKALVGRDHLMYRLILDELDGAGDTDGDTARAKGVFLTNTRHAYKHIRDRRGRTFWNTGTFFHLWHPRRSYSVRLHSVALHIDRRREPDADTAATTAGMERLDYRWVRMEDGLWDSAFRAYGDRPVGIELAATPFGRAGYVGNHMHDAMPGQTMADAYDAVIFLAPLEEQRVSGTVELPYTPEFLNEVARRYRLLYSDEQLARQLAERELASVAALVAGDVAVRPETPLLDHFEVGPADAWKRATAPPGHGGAWPPCTEHEAMAAFRFLAGSWTVTSRFRLPDGRWDETVASAIVEPELGGCVLRERYRGSRDGKPFAARALLSYDALAGRLQKTWVDDGHGTALQYRGQRRDDRIELTTTVTVRDRAVRLRHLYANIDADRFELSSARSFDDGATWRDGWHQVYERVR